MNCLFIDLHRFGLFEEKIERTNSIHWRELRMNFNLVHSFSWVLRLRLKRKINIFNRKYKTSNYRDPRKSMQWTYWLFFKEIFLESDSSIQWIENDPIKSQFNIFNRQFKSEKISTVGKYSKHYYLFKKADQSSSIVRNSGPEIFSRSFERNSRLIYYSLKSKFLCLD